jgi:hypothetical protein
MYYILNETNQIIAADDNLLTLCGVAHIDELASKIARGDIDLALGSNEEVTLNTGLEDEVFTSTQTSLSSLLGHITLVSLSNVEEETFTTPAVADEEIGMLDTLDNETLDTSEEEESLILDDTVSDELEILSEETNDDLDSDEVTSLDKDSQEDEITFGDHLTLDDDIIDSKTEETPTIENDNKEENDSEVFDLLGDTDTQEEESISPTEDVEDEPFSLTEDDNIDLFGDTPKKTDIEDIIINVEEVSQKIGISSDDYNNFLNEFIDTALGLEKDLQSQDNEKQSNAVDTLTHLSDVLHLPNIGDIIKSTQTASADEQREIIESFYGTLSRISTTQEEPTATQAEEEEVLFAPLEETIEEEAIELAPVVEEEAPLELFDTPEVVEEVASIQPTKAPSGNSFGTISLDDVKAKHFDFQLEEAANDLSLPVELIEEFVHDFISQAHIETKKMLEAYEEGDLDAIQKIGHLLKGASSNLRINPLSDTLYHIQFCEDSKNLEPLIKDYWAHFLSFENQINVISN